MDNTYPIAVMDATCALCSAAARTIHRLDRSGNIRICPIQTRLGQQLLADAGLDTLDPDSWLFIEDGIAWHNSDALIRLGTHCGGLGRLLNVLRIIPRSARNWFYYLIARNRYRLFGRSDMCAIPDPEFRKRLLS